MSPIKKAAAVVAAVLAAAALFYSVELRVEADGRAKPNVILISIDTLRAPQMDLYGGPAKTPRLDEFAKHAVWFPQYTANAPWTRPSFASLMTGLYPSTHKADRGRDPNTGAEVWSRPLADSFTTLAEILRGKGYHTAAIVTNKQCGPENGFRQGFDEFYTTIDADLKTLDPQWNSARAMYIQFSRWLDKNVRRHAPLFAWFHFMDPHAPYDPPAAYAKKQLGREYETALAKQLGHVTGWTPARRRTLTPEDVRAIRGLYTAEVEYVDKYVGLLLDKLKQVGLYDNSIVVIVADHGEDLFEHASSPLMQKGLYIKPVGHGNAHWEQLVRVPFMIHYPGVKPRKVTGIASHVDVTPTILDLAGVDSPAAQRFEGRSLVPAIQGRESLDDRLAFISTVPNNPPLWTVRSTAYKLVHHVKENVSELYDLKADPGEQHDLAKRRPEVAARLWAALKQHMARR